MNERIKELAKQAETYADEKSGAFRGEMFMRCFTEKFAELVRQDAMEEVASICDELNTVIKNKGAKMLLFKQFSFEAAHTLPDYPQIHGHSYFVEVWIKGNAQNGYVIREIEIDKECSFIKEILDHKNLNDLINFPTSENIAKFIWSKLSHLPLFSIKVHRPSIGFGVVFEGDDL